MVEVYKSLHPDLFDRWSLLKCYCGTTPTLHQSHSQKNPNRLYLRCAKKYCTFFRWADERILPNDVKDPYSVEKWLTEPAPGFIPPPNQENRHYRKEQWFTKDAATLQPSYSPKPHWGENPEVVGNDLFGCAAHWTDIYDKGPTIGDPEGNSPAPPPPKYSENFADYLKRQEMIETDPPMVHEDVVNRLSLGLF